MWNAENLVLIVYSRHALMSRQATMLTMCQSEHDYTCGAPLTPPEHPLHVLVFARRPVQCGDHIEVCYYKSGYGDLLKF